MNRRIELQAELEEVLGNRNVYFQPPENIQLKFPCIVYERSDIALFHADDLSYHKRKEYSVTVITKDPDSDLVDKILDRFQYCRFLRHFTSDRLNHDVIELYY